MATFLFYGKEEEEDSMVIQGKGVRCIPILLQFNRHTSLVTPSALKTTLTTLDDSCKWT